MFKKTFLSFALLLSFTFCSAAELAANVLATADSGVRAIYNLDFDTANFYIGKLLKDDPRFPIALFGKTMIEWSRFEYEFEKSNPEQAKVFQASIEEAIKGIEKWVEEHGEDAQAFLALGGVYGVKARFQLANRHFIKAYFSGKKGLKYMNKAAKLSPDMYDAYLGEGIYQYYAGTLPAVVKILAKLVVSGNADKGIEYLNMVKDNGRFSADTAKLLLVEISIESEKYRNPALAEQYINEIIAKYPQNPLYRFVGIIAAYENQNYQEVILGAQNFLDNIGKEKFYNKIYTARSYSAIGTAYMALGDYQKAKETFEASVLATKDEPLSRWQLWNIFRQAQVCDALDERNKALDLYSEILKNKETWGIDEEAKKGLKNPFTSGAYPGHMPPP
ncbi:MAG: hypothetical protein LBM71_01350 [Elusimicrobiota bacterium]|jgi:tetratricopeptide (TPR) repeat protein|nr:hypothetical protein [Elusimicrobiota bacterium]